MTARLSGNQEYNVVYDLVRGVCAFAVFFGHVFPYVLWSMGEQVFLQMTPFRHALFFTNIIAVEIFFALSGLLLGPILYKLLSSSSPKRNIRIFLVRRWYRTLPVYYLGFAMSLAVALVYQLDVPENLWEYGVFIQYLWRADEDFYFVSWSLAIEEIFYLLFAALLLIALKIRACRRDVFVIIALSFILRHGFIEYAEDMEMDFRRVSLFRLDAIAIGALVGVYREKLFTISGMVLLYILFLAVGMELKYVSMHDMTTTKYAFHILLTISPWVFAVIVYDLGKCWVLKSRKVITFGADISYSVYVFHVPVLMICASIFGDDTLLTPIVTFITIPAFCYLVFRYIESPILKMRPTYRVA